MKRTIVLLGAIALLALLRAAPAQAFDERTWLLLGGGGAQYGMADLNQELDAFNSTYGSGGLTFDHIEKGTALGVAAGFELRNRWNLGVGMDRMFASTEAFDGVDRVRYQFTANAWRVFGEYALQPVGRTGLRFGAGVGVVGESGKTTIASPGYPTTESKVSGAAPLYEAYAGGDVWFGSRVALSAAGGWRYAKLASVHAGDYEYDSQIDGSPVSIDFSGAFVRLGLKFSSRPAE